MNSFKRRIRELSKTLRGKILIALIASPFVIGFVIGAVALGGHIIMWLWNATITDIFETKPITFWQAVMLLVLFKTLFPNHQFVDNTKRERGKQICDSDMGNRRNEDFDGPEVDPGNQDPAETGL